MVATDTTIPVSVDYTPIFISQLLDTIGGHFDRHAIGHADLTQRLDSVDSKVTAAEKGLAAVCAEVATLRADIATLVVALSPTAAPTPPAPPAVPAPELPAAPN